MPVRREDQTDIFQRCSNGRTAVEDPQQADQKDRPQYLDDPPVQLLIINMELCLQIIIGRRRLHAEDDEDKVQPAPDHEGPVCPVPQAGQRPDKDHGKITGKQFPHARAEARSCLPPDLLGSLSHRGRIEDVIRIPVPQRHVPSLPVVLDRDRKVRLPEVLLQLDPQDLTQAAHNIHITGEIGIQLDPVSKHRRNEIDPGSL